MPPIAEKQKSYFSLAKHNAFQLFIFYFLLASSIVMVFNAITILLDYLFVEYLNGVVMNNGETIPYFIGQLKPEQETSRYLTWAVDIYKDTPQEARYWFNPVLSLFVLSTIQGIAIAFVISLLLPRRLGYMRHKVDREIASLLEKAISARFGEDEDFDKNELIETIKNSNLRELHQFVHEWGLHIEDLKIFRRVLIWRDSGIFYRILHINDAIRFYMRFYFTVKYNNTVLGFVYVGAAVLIIIIGLRGLKFIPPTEPSLVIFALGLEFSLLVTYAFTLMYTKQEEEEDDQVPVHAKESLFMGSEYGNSKEIEQLLRVFIKSKNK